MKKISYSIFAVLACFMASCSKLASTDNAPSTTAVAAKGSFYPAIAVKDRLPSSVSHVDKHGFPSYAVKDRKRYVRTTAYSDQENEPGAEGNLNAAGTTLKYGRVRSAAADWSIYPLGTTFKIKGLPHTYVVDDYGSALVGTNTIDIYHPKLSLMCKWGTRPVEISIIKMGDWERTATLLKGRVKYRHCAQMYAGVMKNLLQRKATAKND